jgi:antitoxin component YwqK of YwqJK toxin-antitoxin module
MLKKHKKNGCHRIINQKTGRLKLVKFYKDGNIHGQILYYWDNGQLRLTGQYVNMRRVGIWKTYDSIGKLIMEENYPPKEFKEIKQLIPRSI